MAANIYIHKKCQSVLSRINQIVGEHFQRYLYLLYQCMLSTDIACCFQFLLGPRLTVTLDQFADRKEEIMYLPVYVDIMCGTIRIGTNIPGSLKHEHQLKTLQHISYILPSKQQDKTLLSDSNYRDLSCSESLQPGHKRMQYNDESSILNMLLELEPHKLVEFDGTESSSGEIIDITDESPRKEKPQYVINQFCGEEPQNEMHAMNTSCSDNYDVVDLTSDNVNNTLHAPKRQNNRPHIKLSYKKKQSIIAKRYRLNKKLKHARFSGDLQELIKTNTKLKSDLLSLTGSVKRMKLLVMLTGKFKNNTIDVWLKSRGKIVNDSVDRQNSCHSVVTTRSNELQHNLQNECLRGNKSIKQKIINKLEEVLEINKEMKINLSSLIVMVNQIKLMLLTSGQFKTQYLKQLQIHLRSCQCMVNDSCDSVEHNYNLEYLRPESCTLNTTWELVEPQSCSPREEVDSIEQIMGKLLKQSRKMNNDLWVIISSVLNLVKDIKKCKVKSST